MTCEECLGEVPLTFFRTTDSKSLDAETPGFRVRVSSGGHLSPCPCSTRSWMPGGPRAQDHNRQEKSQTPSKAEPHSFPCSSQEAPFLSLNVSIHTFNKSPLSPSAGSYLISILHEASDPLSNSRETSSGSWTWLACIRSMVFLGVLFGQCLLAVADCSSSLCSV